MDKSIVTGALSRVGARLAYTFNNQIKDLSIYPWVVPIIKKESELQKLFWMLHLISKPV